VDKIRDWLYIGKLRDTLEITALSDASIHSMLHLAEEVPQPGIIHRYLPVMDGNPLPDALLRAGLDFVAEQRRQEKTTLIACGRGASRSATFAIAALKEAEGISLLDALRAVAAVHRETRPHPVLWQSLCEYYKEPFSLREMVRACPPPGWT